MSGPCLINFVHGWDNMASFKLDWKESEINKETRKTSVISFLIKSGNITEQHLVQANLKVKIIWLDIKTMMYWILRFVSN